MYMLSYLQRENSAIKCIKLLGSFICNVALPFKYCPFLSKTFIDSMNEVSVKSIGGNNINVSYGNVFNR